MNFILKDNFKDILRNLRLEKGLLQKEMAKKLNVSLSTYSKYEQGTSTPNKENLIKIWNFFGVPFSTFINENEEIKKSEIEWEQYLNKAFKDTLDIDYEIKEIMAYILHFEGLKLNGVQRALLEIILYTNFEISPFMNEEEKHFFQIQNNKIDFIKNLSVEKLLKIFDLLYQNVIFDFKNYVELAENE
jgi:toxin-antitoxin system, antitoxin component, xre family